MSAVHSALSALGPVDFTTVPTDPSELGSYMQEHFASAQLLVDSVPPAPSSSITSSQSFGRARSASSASEILPSPVSNAALNSSHTALQKEWGKPMRLGAKDNPLSMAVYKLSAKDGKGSWFARRSTHTGLSFDKWKVAMIREFEESLEVKGAPGAGNVRGIGGEERLEKSVVKGVGNMEVLRLSAQFPGPTTPRDFVTFLLTSQEAMKGSEEEQDKDNPRHFIVISKPCKHPSTEPPGQGGFIRGSYESVEIIREVGTKKKNVKGDPLKRSSSDVDIQKVKDTEDLNKTAVLKRAHDMSKTHDELSADTSLTKVKTQGDAELPKDTIADSARSRGKTISFTETREDDAKGENFDLQTDDDDDHLPVEWIMLTRSDPGGSVPRFMVERGTPSGICNDAVKFLNWACQKELNPDGTSPSPRASFQDGRRTSLLAGLQDEDETQETEPLPAYEEPETPKPTGMISNITSAAVSGLETYAPKAVTDHLPGGGTKDDLARRETIDSDDDTSILSFASAEDHLSDSDSIKSTASTKESRESNTTTNQQDRHVQRLEARRAKLDARLKKVRERDVRDKETNSEKEAARLKKAEERHARELTKAEEKHAKELRGLEERKEKAARKERERKEKEEKKDRDLREKKEREELRAELASIKAERDLLRENVRALQAENTKLVVAVGKVEGGSKILADVREIAKLEGRRSRSASEAGSGKSKKSP